jgi:hypothetical protein
MLAQKSAAGLAAYRGEPKDRPSVVLGAYQPPLRQGFPALASGHRYA